MHSEEEEMLNYQFNLAYKMGIKHGYKKIDKTIWQGKGTWTEPDYSIGYARGEFLRKKHDLKKLITG